MDRKIVEMLQGGHSLREITESLRVGDRRVRRLRILAEDYGYLGETPRELPPYPEALFTEEPAASPRSSEPDALLRSRRDWIEERLQAGWHPITVFEELGLPIGRSSFYRFLQRHALHGVGEKARNQRVVPEIVHEPGSALLLDWGKLRDVVDPETGKKKPLWAFVGVMGFSRYLMVRLVWSNDIPSTMDAIQVMLREIGGVPKKITSDNPKCFAIEASRYEPLLNPVFERLASHYGVRTIECLPPADPEKKGKVERPMPYIRRLYEAHGDAWYGIEESQAYLDRKLAIANQRKHGTTRQQPIEQLLSVEASALAPLPALAYEPETVSDGIVRQDGHVRFENRYYSLAERYIGEKVVLLGSASRVSIYHQGKLIEVHERLTDPNRSKSTKSEHLKPWERAMQDDSQYRKRARAIGTDVERFVIALLARGEGFIDTRRVWGVLSLDKSYAPERINDACRQALELDSLSYRMVKSLLRLQPVPMEGHEGQNESDTCRATPQSHKFVRPMSDYEAQLELLH
jgi:transposase